MTEKDEEVICALNKTRSKMALWMVFSALVILGMSVVAFFMMRPAIAAADAQVVTVPAPAVSMVWDKDGGTPIAYLLNTPSGVSYFCTRTSVKPGVKYSCQPLTNKQH